MPEVTDEELTELRAQAGRAVQLEGELATARETAGQELRAAVVAAYPGLPERLIVGSNAAELQASVAEAEILVSSIRDATLEEMRGLAAGKPPIGFRPPVRSGERAPADLAGMTAAQKVKYGLSQRREGR